MYALYVTLCWKIEGGGGRKKEKKEKKKKRGGGGKERTSASVDEIYRFAYYV